MTNKVGIYRRWLEPAPLGVPKSQWPRKRRHCWVVRWFSLDGRRHGMTVKTKVEAERIQAEKAAEFDRSPATRNVPRKVTLRDFIAEFERLRTGASGQRLKVVTVQEAKRALDRLAETIGRDVPLVNLTPADATRFVSILRESKPRKRRGEKLSPASVNKMIRAIKSAFNVAVNRLGYLKVNPFAGVRQDKVTDKTVRYVTNAEYRALLEAADGRTKNGALWWQAFAALGYTAGLRLSEAIHLTWKDIDFENHTVRIVAKPETDELLAWDPKAKKTRRVPIPVSTVDILAKLQTIADEGNPYVLIPKMRLETIKAAKAAGAWGEGQAILNNIERDWRRLRRAAGVVDVTPHDLRRSAITNWARRLPIHVVQEMAGHTSMETTRRYYLAITADDMRAAREATEDAVRGVVDNV